MKRESIRIAIRMRRMTLDNIAFLRERWDCHSLSETIRRAVNDQAEAERKLSDKWRTDLRKDLQQDSVGSCDNP